MISDSRRTMYFDDVDIDTIPKSNLGRPIKDIGDLNLSHLL